MREVRFALGYMPHRIWGNLLLAQFLEKEQESSFYIPREYIQNDASTEAYKRLTPMQLEVVKIIDSYSDRSLYKRFGGGGTVKEFMNRVGEAAVRERIRPYIETQLYKCLIIARDNRLAVFIKDKGNRNVFPEDFIRLMNGEAVPRFTFQYGKPFRYDLRLEHSGRFLKIRETPAEVLCHDPCALLVGQSLYFIPDVDGRKLLPFTRTEHVVIPSHVEETYFKTFVKTTLQKYNPDIEGIEVNDLKPEMKAELVLETGLDQRPVWILTFLYNLHRIDHESRTNRFVTYLGNKGVPAFERVERNRSWEEERITLLNECGLQSSDQKHFHLRSYGGPEIRNELYSAVNFMNEFGHVLRKAGFVWSHRLESDFFMGRIEMVLNSTEREDWFDVRAEVRAGKLKVPFPALKEHILQGKREFELSNGERLIIPDQWFPRYRSVFEFGIPKEGIIRIHRQHFAATQVLMKEHHTRTYSELQRLNELERIPEFPLPDGLNATLRSYQVEGYRWLCLLQEQGFGGCLADDMGLGKTLQALAVIIRSRGTGSPASLVVVPSSILHNWKNECRQFAFGLRVYVHMGARRKRQPDKILEYDVVLSTYHTVRQDIGMLSRVMFHYIVLDESQVIKNPGSKLYQSMLELQSEHRIVLSGTPIENSLTDLWSQINFVNPGLLGTLGFFRRSFVHPIERKKDLEREKRLKEMISPFILRRTKAEVARELPPVFEQVRFCSMTEPQRRLYEEEKSLARNHLMANLEELGLEKSTMVILQALTRLRQIANHPAMLDELEGIESGKFTEVYRDIENVVSEGHKALVFSSFVKHLELFRIRLDREGYRYAYLTGSHNQRSREQSVRKFQTDHSCPLFLVSLKAGGVGLNLTAADYVFILDPWWNPAAELQAVNRAHRIGQDKNVFVYRFISTDTIEEKIQRLQERKLKLAQTFITTNNPLRGLSRKEVIALFS